MNNSYEIILTDDAITDLEELKYYIATVLRAPATALSYIREIRQAIESLSELPGRIKLLDDEPWHTRGIRRLMVKNFFVYFRIDEDDMLIYIMNIIYNRRDQFKQISDYPQEEN
ncbi:MAG: type II toxin-antitoxin system RelE/ParE family toxin [Clostridiales bacterium]|nr:type II toxin-antitoxin system RelE/ParE family toxin [Clostridiales bacterium]